MMIKNKQAKQLRVGYYENYGNNSEEENVGIEDLKDNGPKIIILENLFLERDSITGDEAFFKELEEEIEAKIESEVNQLNKQ